MLSSDFVPVSSPEQRRLQRSWYWYDWAAASYVTVTAAVLLSPYLTSIANREACPAQPSGDTCNANLHVLGIGIAPGSLVPYMLTLSTVLSAIVLVFVGAIADRSRHPIRLLGGFTYVGAAAACSMIFIGGDNWELGVVLAIVANLALGAALIVYSAVMVRITPPDDRDHVSSRGWAYGYLGGGSLLAATLVLLIVHDAIGLDKEGAVRVAFLVAGLWWALFAIIPLRGLRHLTGVPLESAATGIRGSLRQLRATFASLRYYPQTKRFLFAYLFYNDGMQTVIAVASLYGSKQLGFSESQLVVTILLVQFVAFFGALAFGRLAYRHGAQRMIYSSLFLWTAVVCIACFLPDGQFALWLLLAAGIGVVLGGSQSLSRSLYSGLIPAGRESEFFSLYQAMERGTSWLGTLVFGLVYQWFRDYRLSIVALVIFFGVGAIALRGVRVREGIVAAGNTPPQVV
ncbi:MFS transporter [Flexivirga sp. ID2601S]|uniref:MFS transporter n=1 Tax=Flexivirga aerilata TaxID=1656889 RepID=A0A849ANJ0_9MICO|nr:MFS transporter [Flexivirga aerilata]NNG40971.1 MFS transporter [Flexivirga aerilata]